MALYLVKLGVFTALCYQLIMRTAFCNDTVFKKENAVAETCGSKPMRDKNRSCIICEIVIFLIDLIFRNRIECACRFVENNDGSLFIKRTGKRQLLLFTARKIHGILVQLPLPRHINENKVIESIDPAKDVDAFTHESVGRIVEGKYTFLPCTPAGIMKLLEFYGVEIAGKECVVIGRSNIVGKPMALLLLNASGTVTVCHSKTKNLAEITRRADILVVAIGRANFVTADMVGEGAVVIDVGINRLDNGKLCGDVEFESVSQKASLITPVPGGVGPMTITMLMKNTVFAAKNQKN